MSTRATHITMVVRERSMDHDGYCSDNECTPEARLVLHTVPVPVSLEVDIGEMISLDKLNLLRLPVPTVNQDGSGYCVTEGSPWAEVGDHHDSVVDVVCGMGVVA
jgi:hypothetical protein